MRQERNLERDERFRQVRKDEEYTCREGECRDGFARQLQGPEFHFVDRQGLLFDYLHGC